MEKNTNRPHKGLMQDVNPIDQPKESYRYALNAVNETNLGNRTLLSNEKGNEECYTLPRNYVRIGKVYTKDNEIVIFSTDNISSEIGIVKNCVYTALVNSNCLGFRVTHQIDAIYRLRRGCETVIYFTDGINPVRQVNLSKLEEYYSDAYKAYLTAPVLPFVGEQWNCDLFNLIKDYSVPCFSSFEVKNNGSIEAGSYNFAIQLLDDDLNPTNWITTSRPVNIFHDDIIGVYESINGSSQQEADALGGVMGNTNKSIEITFTNFDTKYTYYRVAVIKASQFTGIPNKVVVSPEIPISQPIFTYSGDINGYVEISAEEIKVGKIDIETVEHIEQLENKLILANIKGKQLNFCEFQQYASKIHSRYIVKEIADTDITETGNPKNPLSPTEVMGFMGGEVYAMGIVYVFKDGFESPVYHIPGPPKNKRWNWNTELCDTVADDTPISPWNANIEHIVPESQETAYNALPNEAKVPKWKVKDTAYNYGGLEGQMAYWECSSLYEDIPNCSSGDYWGKDVCGNDLVGTPIRHHRFPNRKTERHVDNGSSVNDYYKLVITITLNGAFPTPGVPIDLTISYNYNVPPPTAQTPVVINVNDTDFVSGVYTFTIDTEVGEDVANTFSGVAFSGTMPTTYAAEFTLESSVEFVYQNYRNDATLRILGVKFTNVEYPHPDIVGHYFVRAERDAFNRTILDSGIAGRARSKSTDFYDYITFSYFTFNNNDDRGHSYLMNPKFLYKNEVLVPEYLKVENIFNYSGKSVKGKRFDGLGWFVTNVDTLIETRVQNYNGVVTTNGDENYSKEKLLAMDGLSYDDNYETGERAYNLSWSNRVQLIKLGRALPDYKGSLNRDIPYVTLRVDRNVHCNLDSITYYKMHNCMLVANAESDTFGMYSGDVVVTKFDLSNSLLREYFNGIVDDILLGLGIIAAAAVTILTAGTGAAVISAIGAFLGATASSVLIPTIVVVTALVAGTIGVSLTIATAIINAYKDTDLDEMAVDSELDGLFSILENFMAYGNEYLSGIYVESEINTGLRQVQNHDCGKYYIPGIGETPIEYFRDRWMFYDQDEEKFLPKGLCCPETYHYNLDFSRMDKQKVYFPLPKTYDCCSDCLESFPERVYYSEVSFQEELSDNYRVFLSNNYRDIEAEHGGITGLIRKGNSLFILTEECLWMLPQNVQQSVVNELVTFIGTGEYFGIPPRKMIDSDMGSAGTRHKWSICKTPLGAFYVSEYEKAVYLISGGEGGLAKISGEGLHNWFWENLNPYLANQYLELIGQPYPYPNNPNNPNSVGIHSVFDPRHQRVIFTKRDYLIRPAYRENFNTISIDAGYLGLIVNQLYYSVTQNKFVRFTGIGFADVPFTNGTYFENKSFTISFSLLNKAWTSFHSYIPLFYSQDQNTFYSANGVTDWKHNIKGLYQKFYGTLYSHIIELVSVSNPINTRLWEDIQLQTFAQKYDSTNDDYYEQKDVTFNYLTVYNSRQISGEVEMISKDLQANPEDYFLNQTVNNVSSIVINKTERDWTINDFKDVRINYAIPMFTKDWASISTQYPIDKVINPASINVNKDWSQQESFRDKYLIIRLRFANFDDVELTTNFTLETEQNSTR